MRWNNSRILIFLLFAIWIGGMLYFFTSSNDVEVMLPGEHARLVQEGKMAREKDHQHHQDSDKSNHIDKKYDFKKNIVVVKDPNQRNKILRTDNKKLEDFDWKGYVQRGALKPGEDRNARNAYNQEASEKLAWDRPIPDVRDAQ